MSEQPKVGSDAAKATTTQLNDTYRWIISGVCILLFIIHIGLQLRAGELTKLDPTAIVIALIGLSPWIARILSSARFAGVELRFLEQKVNEQGNDLDTIKFLVGHFLSASELEWLKKFLDSGGVQNPHRSLRRRVQVGNQASSRARLHQPL